MKERSSRRDSEPSPIPPPGSHWYSPVATYEPRDPQSGSGASRRGKARERMLRRRQDRAFPAVNWSWAVMIAAIIGVVGVISLIMLASTGQSNPPPTAALLATSAPLAGKTSVAGLPPNINIRPWDGKQRFTVLVMGIDKRPGE